MHDICRFCNLPADGGAFFTLKKGKRCGGDECRKNIRIAGLYRSTDGRCADGSPFAFFAWDYSAFDAGARKIMEHNLIIETRDMALLFFANVAARDKERLRDPGKDGNIELRMAADRAGALYHAPLRWRRTEEPCHASL